MGCCNLAVISMEKCASKFYLEAVFNQAALESTWSLRQNVWKVETTRNALRFELIVGFKTSVIYYLKESFKLTVRPIFGKFYIQLIGTNHSSKSSLNDTSIKKLFLHYQQAESFFFLNFRIHKCTFLVKCAKCELVNDGKNTNLFLIQETVMSKGDFWLKKSESNFQETWAAFIIPQRSLRSIYKLSLTLN